MGSINKGIMICLLLFGLVFSLKSAPFNDIDPSNIKENRIPALTKPQILNLDYTREGAGDEIKLTWKLSKPVDHVVVCRGSKQVVLLPGNAEEFTYTEEKLGYFRYTVALYHNKQWVDHDDVLVSIGKIGWDPPESSFSGYYLYIAEATGDPYTVLPYDNPYEYDLDVLIYDRVWLSMLYSMGMIEDGKKYYVATSSYLTGCPDTVVSPLSEPVSFEYHVVLDSPVP